MTPVRTDPRPPRVQVGVAGTQGRRQNAQV
jgi:hypothetical protein